MRVEGGGVRVEGGGLRVYVERRKVAPENPRRRKKGRVPGVCFAV